MASERDWREHALELRDVLRRARDERDEAVVRAEAFRRERDEAIARAEAAERALAAVREALRHPSHKDYKIVSAVRDALDGPAEPPAWQRKPITHEWARASIGLTPAQSRAGGFVDVALLLSDGWTVHPHVPFVGCPATRPIEPTKGSERGEP